MVLAGIHRNDGEAKELYDQVLTKLHNFSVFCKLFSFFTLLALSGTESTLRLFSPSFSCQRWSTAQIFSGFHNQDDYDV